MGATGRQAVVGIALYSMFLAAPAASGQAAIRAGTTVVVTLKDAMDSGQDPSGKQINAKITETLLGPVKPTGQYMVSPDGGHLAVAAMHGSREIVIVDGVDGPDFDHAANLAGAIDRDDIAFSPDGKRSAYVAQRGDQLVAVVDGKEAFTVVSDIKTGSVPGIEPYFNGLRSRQHQFLFSPSGAHFAVVAREGQVARMYLDGVKSPPYAEIDGARVAFAGEKLVYVAKGGPDGKWHVVTNSTPGPGYDEVPSLVVSDNKQHYAYIGRLGGTSVVVADGVVGTPRPNVVASSGLHNLVVASTGRVAYLGYSGNGAYKEVLYLGNQEVAPEVTAFAGPVARNGMAAVLYVVFSPDGSKIAYVKPVPGGSAAVIDGKTSIPYDKIGQMGFGPDSRRAYFVGLKQVTGNYLVIDGQEMPVQNKISNVTFSADGSRFGYEAYHAQNGFSVVVDGKASDRFLNLIGNALAFSADGKHSVYVGCTNYGKCQLVVDGTATNLPGVGDFTSRTRPQVLPPPVLYSPDGRLAYTYPKSDGTNRHGIVVGGQEIAGGVSVEFPMWSPDGKHFAMIVWNGKGYSAVVDGKTVATFEDIFEANGNVVRFLDARTLRVLAVKGGNVYRITIDLQ